MITSVLFLCCLGLVGGLLLELFEQNFAPETASLSDEINNLLPQTQCGQCLFAGCKPYAEAIAKDEAEINRCPPGGQATIDALASLLGKPVLSLDETHGTTKAPQVAVIIEKDCIGCVKCINACPVDAILGAAKQMHTVLPSLCTGCELCIEPCPVDCIVMEPLHVG